MILKSKNKNKKSPVNPGALFMAETVFTKGWLRYKVWFLLVSGEPEVKERNISRIYLRHKKRSSSNELLLILFSLTYAAGATSGTSGAGILATKSEMMGLTVPITLLRTSTTVLMILFQSVVLMKFSIALRIL